MNVIEINKGIACRVKDTIYVNKELQHYPELRKVILDHEKNHTESFTMRDIFLDLDIKELKGMKKQYYTFILKNPSSWIEFLPLKKYGNTVLFNLPIALIWLFGGLILCVILFGMLL